MELEPRPLPDYKNEVDSKKWYCLHCDQYRHDPQTMKTHVVAYHDIQHPDNGEDYAEGFQIERMQLRRKLFEQAAAERFALVLSSQRGADDFLLDVGDGVPDA